MKEKLLIVLLVVLIFVIIATAERPVVQILEPTPTLPPITIEGGGLEYFYLTEKFGEDLSAWPPDAYEMTDALFECIHDWWNVATEEQLRTTPMLRVITVCWAVVNE